MPNFDQTTVSATKGSVFPIHFGAWSFFAAVFLALMPSCSDGDTSDSQGTSSANAAGNDTDTQKENADTGETEEDGRAGDTGTVDDTEEPFPSKLETACSVTAEQIPASEDRQDIETGPRGDGRHPAAASSGEGRALLAWAYKHPDSLGPWVIQTASYGPDEGLGSRAEPGMPKVSARSPALAWREGVFGLVWRDARWDADCNAESARECEYSLAFLALDADGTPTKSAEPSRLTYGTNIQASPVIAATDEGWLVAGVAEGALFTLPVTAGGEPKQQNRINTKDGVKDGRGVALAEGTDGALVACWIAQDEWSLWCHRLDAEGQTRGDAVMIFEGSQVRSPALVATDSGYVLAWARSKNGMFEAYGLSLDSDGSPVGKAKRLTWSSGGVREVDLAWNKKRGALAFVSPKSGDNTDKCSVDSCHEQVFVRLIDEEGTALGRSAQLSGDPNPSSALEVFFDGKGYTAAWETRRQLRQQVYYGRAVCSE